MISFIRFADNLSAWFGKAFAWLILLMSIGTGYEVFVRYVLNNPTAWALDVSFIMYGTLFMMGGAYTLSRGGHVRGDFLYRLLKPRTQGMIDLVLYVIFFFPGVTAMIFAFVRARDAAPSRRRASSTSGTTRSGALFPPLSGRRETNAAAAPESNAASTKS